MLVDGYDAGLVAREGLLAHGRGEAFDYILDEKTQEFARDAIRAASAAILLAEHPVISVNGNVAALCPEELRKLARESDAALEVNLFYDSDVRRQKIARIMRSYSGGILGVDPAFRKRLGGSLDSARATVDARGILKADLVVVPLEDGDRTGALKAAGKTVIAFDLNPLSRTARDADITIVDNVVRAVVLLADSCRSLAASDRAKLEKILAQYDNDVVLSSAIRHMEQNLRRQARAMHDMMPHALTSMKDGRRNQGEANLA